MRNCKRAGALTLSAALALTLMSGCSRGGEGLSLSVWTGAAPVSLDPIYASAPSDQTILAHLYEPLMCRQGTETVGGAARDVETEENEDTASIYFFVEPGYDDVAEVLQVEIARGDGSVQSCERLLNERERVLLLHMVQEYEIHRLQRELDARGGGGA